MSTAGRMFEVSIEHYSNPCNAQTLPATVKNMALALDQSSDAATAYFRSTGAEMRTLQESFTNDLICELQKSLTKVSQELNHKCLID